MLARILEDEKLVTSTSLKEIVAALAAKKRIWIDLERQSSQRSHGFGFTTPGHIV